MELNKIYNEDCLEGMRKLEENSVDLILTDPPYNIGKDSWDKWKKQEDYIEFMMEVFDECQRVLKPAGSMYWFHNDMPQIVDLMVGLRDTDFIFRQMIVWNKRFEGSRKKGFMDGFVYPLGLRNYQQMVEYIMYYTFQDGTGLDKVKKDVENFKSLRDYFRNIQEYIGCTKKSIVEIIGGRADHCFRHSSSQWDLPTEDTYNDIINKFNIDKYDGFREYESLREEYESLREEYESLRYTFNNQQTNHSVWNYDKDDGGDFHSTPKPVKLLENIINHSSNSGDVVLDCFMGSGSTAIACMNTDRSYIGFELDEGYYDKSIERIDKHLCV